MATTKTTKTAAKVEEKKTPAKATTTVEAKPAAKKVETKAPAKKAEVKTEVKAEVKAPAKKAETKTPAKKAETKTAAKAEAKKPAAKKPAAKKEKNVLVQFAGMEFDTAKIEKDVVADYKAKNGKKTATSVSIYIKPEDMKAYYVIDGIIGDIAL